MAKKIKIVLAVLLVVVMSVTVLAACNGLKWDKVDGGDPDAVVESQGGFVTKQGGYIYFINGYTEVATDNTFGACVQGSIVRMTLDENKNPITSTAKIIVPLNVYSTSTKVAFAIYGDQIYYVTPNTENDKSGTPSTTHLNVMRSNINGSKPEVLLTLDSRSYTFNFYPGRIVWYDSNTSELYSADLTLKNQKKVTKSVKTIASGISAVQFLYADSYTKGQAEAITDFILYTKYSETDTTAFNNELYAVKYDGSRNDLVVGRETFFDSTLSQAQNEAKNIFRITISQDLAENSTSHILYYTKAIKESGSEAARGLFFARLKLDGGKIAIDVASERRLTTDSAQTTFTPISYDSGVLMTISSNVFLVPGVKTSESHPSDMFDSKNAIIGEGLNPTVMLVRDGYIYYFHSSTFYRLDMSDKLAQPEILSTVISRNTTWMDYEIWGDKLFYIDSNNYDYVTIFDMKAADGDVDAAFTWLISEGTMLAEDYEAFVAREEEKAKEAE